MFLRGLDKLYGSLVIHRLLLRRAATGATAGGEDHGVTADHRMADVPFEVGHYRLSAELSKARGLILVPDHSPHLVAFFSEQPDEVLSDLPVRPGDEHPHGSILKKGRRLNVLPPSGSW